MFVAELLFTRGPFFQYTLFCQPWLLKRNHSSTQRDTTDSLFTRAAHLMTSIHLTPYYNTHSPFGRTGGCSYRTIKKSKALQVNDIIKVLFKSMTSSKYCSNLSILMAATNVLFSMTEAFKCCLKGTFFCWSEVGPVINCGENVSPQQVAEVSKEKSVSFVIISRLEIRRFLLCGTISLYSPKKSVKGTF